MKEEIIEVDNTDEIIEAAYDDAVIEEILNDEYDDTDIEEDFDNEYDDSDNKGLSRGFKITLLLVGTALCGVLFSGVFLKFINWIIFN